MLFWSMVVFVNLCAYGLALLVLLLWHWNMPRGKVPSSVVCFCYPFTLLFIVLVACIQPPTFPFNAS